ncbi:hypothetical protein HDU81_009978 [Chytriomyces hyalinus]|nr:hypothetical protein HDU81_009978 [Chytriomyces hyalinus]
MHRQLVRRLSTAAPAFARRRVAPGSDALAAGAGAEAAVAGLTGKWDVDGLTRYEVDLAETAVWVGTLLSDMGSPLPSKSKLVKNSFTPSAVGIALEETRSFVYELQESRANGTPSNASLHVRVADLKLAPTAQHKFLQLAAPFYNGTDLVTMHSKDASLSAAAAKLSLLEQLDAMLVEAKKEDSPSAQLLEKLPIDLRHLKRQKRDLSFPEHWKKPVPQQQNPVHEEAAL